MLFLSFSILQFLRLFLFTFGHVHLLLLKNKLLKIAQDLSSLYQEAIKARFVWELTQTCSLENWKGLFSSIFPIPHFSCYDPGTSPRALFPLRYKCVALSFAHHIHLCKTLAGLRETCFSKWSEQVKVNEGNLCSHLERSSSFCFLIILWQILGRQ